MCICVTMPVLTSVCWVCVCIQHAQACLLVYVHVGACLSVCEHMFAYVAQECMCPWRCTGGGVCVNECAVD